MYGTGVDTLASVIINDPSFLVMLITSVLNECLTKQPETFTKYSQGNAENKLGNKISLIAELLQS